MVSIKNKTSAIKTEVNMNSLIIVTQAYTILFTRHANTNKIQQCKLLFNLDNALSYKRIIKPYT
ncbi:hypothetical protein GCM10023149_12010 [Mucilaginibacter gynuensis]|uniref:Uncharacterized protein n=1 Tax=Mucilaginibacter gynuensis TaxID=1302236 RepID=A0ABP8G1G7_9SPHI